MGPILFYGRLLGSRPPWVEQDVGPDVWLRERSIQDVYVVEYGARCWAVALDVMTSWRHAVPVQNLHAGDHTRELTLRAALAGVSEDQWCRHLRESTVDAALEAGAESYWCRYGWYLVDGDVTVI